MPDVDDHRAAVDTAVVGGIVPIIIDILGARQITGQFPVLQHGDLKQRLLTPHRLIADDGPGIQSLRLFLRFDALVAFLVEQIQKEGALKRLLGDLALLQQPCRLAGNDVAAVPEGFKDHTGDALHVLLADGAYRFADDVVGNGTGDCLLTGGDVVDILGLIKPRGAQCQLCAKLQHDIGVEAAIQRRTADDVLGIAENTGSDLHFIHDRFDDLVNLLLGQRLAVLQPALEPPLADVEFHLHAKVDIFIDAAVVHAVDASCRCRRRGQKQAWQKQHHGKEEGEYASFHGCRLLSGLIRVFAISISVSWSGTGRGMCRFRRYIPPCTAPNSCCRPAWQENNRRYSDARVLCLPLPHNRRS